MRRTTWSRACWLVVPILLIASQQLAAQAGHLDTTFGTGGIVTTDFGDQRQTGNIAAAMAAVIQPDGKIVIGGEVPGSSGFPVPAVARYNTNGSLDTSFGTSGITSITSLEDIGFSSITLQSDGKILALAGGFSAFLARFTTTGALDSSFGTSGIVTLQFINGPVASGVVVQSDGTILVADGSLFRLLSNGQLDTSFGNAGTAKTAGYPASGLILLPSGKILTSSSQTPSGFMSQYDANGSLDTTFGISGQLATPGTAAGLVLLASGDFVAGGSLSNNSIPGSGGFAASAFAVSRYLGAGVMDASFGTNGGTAVSVPRFLVVSTNGIAAEPNGDFVTVGTASQSSESAFALARFTANGQVDTTFGTNGVVVTSFGGGFPPPSVSANGLAIQSDGKIVVVGGYSVSVPHNGFDTAFKVARYLAQ